MLVWQLHNDQASNAGDISAGPACHVSMTSIFTNPAPPLPNLESKDT